MRRYLAELYLPKSADIASATARAKAVAGEADPAHYLRSIFVPEDETWFLLYEAPTIAAVEEAVEAASLPCARIVEAVALR